MLRDGFLYANAYRSESGSRTRNRSPLIIVFNQAIISPDCYYRLLHLEFELNILSGICSARNRFVLYIRSSSSSSVEPFKRALLSPIYAHPFSAAVVAVVVRDHLESPFYRTNFICRRGDRLSWTAEPERKSLHPRCAGQPTHAGSGLLCVSFLHRLIIIIIYYYGI